MNTSTRIHLSTVAAISGIFAFVVICILRPIVLLFVVGAVLFVFLYGTLYIFISARFVQAKRRRREERLARELKLRTDFGLSFEPLTGEDTDVKRRRALAAGREGDAARDDKQGTAKTDDGPEQSIRPVKED